MYIYTFLFIYLFTFYLWRFSSNIFSGVHEQLVPQLYVRSIYSVVYKKGKSFKVIYALYIIIDLFAKEQQQSLIKSNPL